MLTRRPGLICSRQDITRNRFERHVFLLGDCVVKLGQEVLHLAAGVAVEPRLAIMITLFKW